MCILVENEFYGYSNILSFDYLFHEFMCVNAVYPSLGRARAVILVGNEFPFLTLGKNILYQPSGLLKYVSSPESCLRHLAAKNCLMFVFA